MFNFLKLQGNAETNYIYTIIASDSVLNKFFKS